MKSQAYWDGYNEMQRKLASTPAEKRDGEDRLDRMEGVIRMDRSSAVEAAKAKFEEVSRNAWRHDNRLALLAKTDARTAPSVSAPTGSKVEQAKARAARKAKAAYLGQSAYNEAK